jgi:hypothetical protein
MDRDIVRMVRGLRHGRSTEPQQFHDVP